MPAKPELCQGVPWEDAISREQWTRGRHNFDTVIRDMDNKILDKDVHCRKAEARCERLTHKIEQQAQKLECRGKEIDQLKLQLECKTRATESLQEKLDDTKAELKEVKSYHDFMASFAQRTHKDGKTIAELQARNEELLIELELVLKHPRVSLTPDPEVCTCTVRHVESPTRWTTTEAGVSSDGSVCRPGSSA